MPLRKQMYLKDLRSKDMTNEDRWTMFINGLRAYIDEHHLGPSKHTDLYNQTRYFRRKMKEGTLSEDKVKELESVLGMRDLSLHTGGRKRLKG